MRIIQRYLTAELFKSCLLALFVLVSMFAFFTLIDQLEDTGRGSYGITEAVVYTLLTAPRIAYELFPIAAVIGSMAVLGILARNNELDVLLTSGLSRSGLLLLMVRSSLLVVVVAVLVGELIAPVAEDKAQTLRALSLTENITMKSKYGFWIRAGDSYINIRRVLPGNRIEDVYYYEFDDQHRLRNSFHAGSAVYEDGQWLMKDLRESTLGDTSVESRKLDQAVWQSLINPEIINVVTVKPQYLSMPGLARYITYLRQNAQNTQFYEQALWAKLTRPFAIIAMIALAVPLVAGPSRTSAIGQRVFTGALAGIVFHILTQVSENLGVVYQLPPALSVTAPIVLLVAIIFYLLHRQH